jgi:hypothetical protein
MTLYIFLLLNNRLPKFYFFDKQNPDNQNYQGFTYLKQ